MMGVASNGVRSTLIACAVVLLSGCGVYEALGGMPRAEGEIATGSASVRRVFSCADHTIRALHKSESSWITDVTRVDPDRGVWESGDFNQANRGGFRVRLKVREGVALVALKGGGAYYHDLGVDRALKDFQDEMAHCLRQPSGDGAGSGT